MTQVAEPHATDGWEQNWTGPTSTRASTTDPEISHGNVPALFAPIEQALAALARGELVLVVDDEDRENEGDLIMAAELATVERVAFMVRHTSGVLCVALTGERLDALQVPRMVATSTESMGTAFTVTVDARGVGTGISAADRAHTVRTLADPSTEPADLLRPGHVFPLRAREGGVLKRAGHTEAGVDLARLAGLRPAALLAEVVNEDGSMARRPDLQRFARQHGLVMISVADLIAYRRHRETLVRPLSSARLPTTHGPFVAHVYESVMDGEQHLALVHGTVTSEAAILVRVHSECLTGDVFGSQRCDCGQQLDLALQRVVAAGAGVVLYLRGHEGRGIGLSHKLRAYALQEQGLDTVEANLALGLPVDTRDYGVGAQILVDLGVRRMRLMTNNPAKYAGLDGYGLEIVERVPLLVEPRVDNLRYLRAKQEKLGHLLGLRLEQAGG